MYGTPDVGFSVLDYSLLPADGGEADFDRARTRAAPRRPD